MQVACSVPNQEYSLSPSPTVAVQIPSIMKRNQEYSFVLDAMPSSICHIGVGYYNSDSEWTIVELRETPANIEGKCEWKWTIPENAKDGVGEVRGYIETEGQEDTNLFPQTFCIEQCP